MEQERARHIGSRFRIAGSCLAVGRLDRGHIHDTFVVSYQEEAGTIARYVHQRLNTTVFREPEALMDNVVRVTAHLGGKLRERAVADPERRCLALVSARDGRSFHVDEEGRPWRTYAFVEGAHTHDTVAGPRHAFEAARAFAAFVGDLADLPEPPLSVTIPDFHDLAGRFSALEQVARADVRDRVRGTGPEIEAASRWFARLQGELGELALPRRTVHNDCKINNVMIDDATGAGLCVIDLDTVMEGTVLWDFGDLVRTATCRAAEDEVDLDRIDCDPELFRALAQGYLTGGRPFLTAPEREVLALAGPVVTLETAVRFLTDHLDGDGYFRTHREDHNLERARAQLRLVDRMSERRGEMHRLVMDAARAG